LCERERQKYRVALGRQTISTTVGAILYVNTLAEIYLPNRNNRRLKGAKNTSAKINARDSKNVM
jgi:hypothetical protein